MAAHYGTVVIPARPGRPRDKAKVEVGVQIAQRWILACLCNRKFYSLDELNQAIDELLERLNTRPFVKLEGCRRSVFETLERPAMRPLPATRYQLAVGKTARVNIDHHVEYDGRIYSVAYQLIGKSVEIRATTTTVEIARGCTWIVRDGPDATQVDLTLTPTKPRRRPQGGRP